MALEEIISLSLLEDDPRKPITFSAYQLTHETLFGNREFTIYQSIELGGCETQLNTIKEFLVCFMLVSI